MNSVIQVPRTLDVGDIHGCDRALEGVLDLAEWRSEGHLICVGDLTIVRGNHEEGFLTPSSAARGPAPGGGTEGGTCWIPTPPPGRTSCRRATLPSCGARSIWSNSRTRSSLTRPSTRPCRSNGRTVRRSAGSGSTRMPCPIGRGRRSSADTHRRSIAASTATWGGSASIRLDTWAYDRCGCLTALELKAGTLYQVSEWDSWVDIASLGDTAAT